MSSNSTNHEAVNQPGVRSAVISTPSASQMGGPQPLPYVRVPFYPTAPWYSTNPQVSYQTRFYTCVTFRSSDADFQVGSEMVRPVQFDLPCRVIAINGVACSLDDPLDGRFHEGNMNLAYRIRIEHTTGDKLIVSPRLAASVVGTGKYPGEIGGHGYNIDRGSTLQIGVTPLVDDIQIDLTFVCLEMRGPRNFTTG